MGLVSKNPSSTGTLLINGSFIDKFVVLNAHNARQGPFIDDTHWAGLRLNQGYTKVGGWEAECIFTRSDIPICYCLCIPIPRTRIFVKDVLQVGDLSASRFG